MTCPRCETRNLTELDRNGVTIDRCEQCRGIWLDRGELDKLLTHARNDERGQMDDERGDTSDDLPRGTRRGHDRDDRDDRDEPPKRRRGSIWDIFD
jgi:hypothetical protein